ncbi:MAG: RNA methyltransferase [Desulfobacteraceae bacterium]|nr:RNA methyltransferase [Desulfobacteraceae bacterium]MBL7225834.1 RNA methyltransferase [Desulfobacteraceae bacterium]
MKANLDNIAIVLVQPQIPENIGAAARAMNNMGLSRLVLIEPKNCDPCRVLKTATGSSNALIEKMEIYHDLREALAPYHYLIGTTARTGSLRPTTARPQLLAQRLVSVSQNNLIGILFGPEDRGLSNEQLRHCHTVVTIPTASFSSLNLAQAVMIICYEIFLGTSERSAEVMPRLANSFELEGMYDHLKDVLLKIGFINPQNPEHWIGNIRRFLSRFPLRAREVRIIRGVCRQIDWYTSQVENRARSKEEKG